MTSTEQIVWAHRVDKSRRGHAGRDAARLRRPAAGVGRHGAVRDPHLQSDHRRRRHLSAAGGDRQRSLRLHRQGRRRQADRDRPRVRAAARHREAVLRDARRRHLPFLLSRAGARRCRASSSPAPTRTAAPTAPTARSAWASDRRRSGSAGRPATSTSRWRRRGAWCSAAAAAVGQRQGHRARAAAAVGREAVAGHVGGAGRREPAAADRVSQHHREHDGGGGSAQRHLRARRHHLCVVPGEGHGGAAVSAVRARRRRRATRSTRRSISAV